MFIIELSQILVAIFEISLILNISTRLLNIWNGTELSLGKDERWLGEERGAPLVGRLVWPVEPIDVPFEAAIYLVPSQSLPFLPS